MTEDSLTFGDVFEFGDREFIFLALTLDNLYVATILPTEKSKDLDRFCSSKVRKNFSRTDSPLYCYIILTTEEVKERAAQFGFPALENCLTALHKLPVILNKKDLEDLKSGILNTRATPGALKEIVKGINLD